MDSAAYAQPSTRDLLAMKTLTIVRTILVTTMAPALMGTMILHVGVGPDSWDSYVKKMFLIAMHVHVLMVEPVMMKSTTFAVLVQ